MWMPRATVVVLVGVAAVAGVVGAAAEGFAAAAQAGPDVASDGEPLALALGGTLVGVGWTAAGALLAWLRPGNAVGWVLLLVGALTQLSLSEEAFATAGWLGGVAAAGDWTARPVGLLLTLVVGWIIMTMLGSLPAIYPEGRLRSSAWRWPVLLVALGAVLIQVKWVADQPSLAGTVTPEASGPVLVPGLEAVPFLVFFAGAAVIWVFAAVALLRSTPPRRQQLGWLLGSVVLILVVNMLGESLPVQVAQIASLYLLPSAIAVALLRYRLLGIDASRGADPMRTVAEIGTHVTSSEDGELLPAVLSSVRRSVDSRGARLTDSSGAVIATSGEPSAPGFTADLVVAGVPVGTLEVAPRWPDGGFSPREERMNAASPRRSVALSRPSAPPSPSR